MAGRKRSNATLLVTAVAEVKAVLVTIAHHGISCRIVEGTQIENFIAGFKRAGA